jgi:hypothetical protein
MRGLLMVKGEEAETEQAEQKKKDHENNKSKYKVRTQEPNRTIEQWKQTTD